MIEAVIVDVVRTASGKGKLGGALSVLHPADLLASVLDALVTRNGLDPALIDDVIGGCVNQASEQSTNITRTAVLAAGFPEHVPATTIDRQCGSSQQAATFAAQAVMSGMHDVVIACGVESMSRVPMGTSAQGNDIYGQKLRARYPDGLVNQGVAAELIAAQWGLSRAELDDFAARSHERAADAAAAHAFDHEIVPLRLRTDAGGAFLHSRDETVRPATTTERLAELPASFVDAGIAARFPEIGWKITAGNSSPLTDGASAALIMSRERATELGLRPRARFVSFAVVGDDPIMMLTGPIPATQKVLNRARLSADEIDVFEVNEAFAPVPLAWANEINVPETKLNPRGGAIALGHALGSSGTRLLATLVNELEANGGRYGLQTMCEGGGMANATIIERL
ncbi:acetyl-CoA acyltransferase [Microbacterium halimionae]|uniref:Acetyl-CoA acyltransferase n=1 Tax=Microbacterium halimionae TaxID=1526413 RepID=A0A7W3PLU3_9MICO|nr:thiolase family protein [Microbacterium halimionae]MBA8816356.1 acetyl-CoA acyltransferase [Microbacterium halimionae]NII96558.1 acetyl-CoA acyltransferase [Microbacterium halimionae]